MWAVVTLLYCNRSLAAQAEICAKLLEQKPDWPEQEKWVWQQTCVGRVANLQEQYGGGSLPEDAKDWPQQRNLTSAFVRTILSDEVYRSRIPSEGVQIKGARF